MADQAILALADGTIFHGLAVGAIGVSVGEVVFNTSMTGYQEILTDPSYAQQLITFTYPHIGNTGVNLEDVESSKVYAQGFIARDMAMTASNYRSTDNLSSFLKSSGCVGIYDIDTRHLTHVLRETGSQGGCIMSGPDANEHTALAKAQQFAGLLGKDLASVVTTKQRYSWDEGVWRWNATPAVVDRSKAFHVVAYDFGVKQNILRMLAERGCFVTVVPATTAADDVLALTPDGVFLSNGPGDPEPCTYAIEAIQAILEHDIPTFGICLGYQLLALASGAKTEKMKFGHHGGNHPVQSLDTQEVMITSQNHGFAVSENHLPSCLRITHRSLFDQSLQGLHRVDRPAFGFQGHPEASPGPHDCAPLFDYFIDLMRSKRALSS